MPYKTKDQKQNLPKHARKTSEAHGTTKQKAPTPKRGAYHTDMNNPKVKSD